MGVTIIGVLLLLLGLIILMAVNMVDAFEGVEGFELGIQVAMLAFGVIYMLLAVGFLKGWAWVWTLTMVVLILGLITDIVSWPMSGEGSDDILSTAVGLIMPVIILLYMRSAKVRAFFGK